jgi:CheY-like chemotaxis protein
VLVVDDEPDIATVLAEILQEEGYRVATAFHGQEALQLLEKRAFDLVVSDVMMPVMTGAELLQRLRAHPRLAHLPVVLISAGPVEPKVRALAAAFLSKPFDLRKLLRAVAGILESGAKQEQGR